MLFAASVALATGPLCQGRGVHYLSGVLINSFAGGAISEVEKSKTVNQSPYGSVGPLSCVMKFGGSSVASAERIREVAELILSFPEERPVIVLSAMGKMNDKLLQAGEKAVSCGVSNVSDMAELSSIKELHLMTIDELGVDRSTISALLNDLELFLKEIVMMKEMAPRTKDYLVSFGVRMSTRIFAAYLNKIGAKARQYDAFDIGFITTDDFTNADILKVTYPAVAKRLHGDWICDPAIPVVTGFLGKGCESRAVTTLGRGGSDLTATTIGKALGLQEIQVWTDLDGVLTCDPNIYPDAEPVPYLTFDEAAELAYFNVQVLHPQSLQPAREGDIPVRVKNSYNPKAPGTFITRARDMSKSVLTGIVVKQNAIILDIGSTRMLGQSRFLAKVFSIFEKLGISADVVATSEVSILLNLDPSMLLGRELIQQDLDHVVEELQKIAIVNHLQNKSIISLVGNMQYSSLIIEKVLGVLRGIGVKVQMTSQGASKEKISFIVNDSKAEQCVRVLHLTFFAMGLNTADAFQNGFAESSRETTMVEGLAPASHLPCSNATPSGLASASNVLDSNSTPVGLASVLDSNSTPVRLASVLGSNSMPIGLASVLDNSTPIRLASVLDSNSTPSVSASASHVPNSNATPSGSAFASHMQEPHTTSFEFYSNLLTGEIRTVVHSRDGKVSLGIMFGLIGLVLGWQMIRRQ